MEKIAIIGTGLSAMSTIEALKSYKKFQISVFETGSKNNIKFLKEKKTLFPNKSFKYASKIFETEKKKFKKLYKIKENKFFLSSVGGLGGLSNYWGGGVQIPKDDYYEKYKIPNKMQNYKKEILSILNLNKKNISLLNVIRKNPLYKKLNTINDKQISIEDLNISLDEKNIKKTFTTRKYFIDLHKKKKIKLYLSHSVKNIVQIKDKYELEIEKKNKNILLKDFDIVISCAGLIGSSYLVAKFHNELDKKFIFYNNDIYQLCFFNKNLKTYKFNKFQFPHPLKKIKVKYKNFFSEGSILPMSFLNNKILGFSKNNVIYNYFKKFLIVGNFFIDSKLSENYLKINEKGEVTVKFKKKKNSQRIIKKFKNIVNNTFKKNKFFSIPYLNFKNYQIGSDSHYTSSLYFYKKKNKKILDSNCKVLDSRNFFVFDSSSIPPGMFYPTYLTMLNAFFNAKKIIKKYEKNK